MCPAATGFTHHISPWGDIEPCPIIQFSKESIHDERPLREVFNESQFLRDFRQMAAANIKITRKSERTGILFINTPGEGKDKESNGLLVDETQHLGQYRIGCELVGLDVKVGVLAGVY